MGRRIDQYDIVKDANGDDVVLGLGCFSKVLKVVRQADGTEWAMKRVELLAENNDADTVGVISSYMSRESYMMHDLQHPNIMRMEEVFVDDDCMCFIFELMPMTLAKHMEDFNTLYPDMAKDLMQQLLSAVEYLHARNIIHRDVKPNNILIDNSRRSGIVLKLSDFGLARGFIGVKEQLSPKVGTPAYMAPEILLGSDDYDQAVDMWSIGCLFATMVLGGVELFEAGTERTVMKSVCRVLGAPTEENWPGLSELPGWSSFLEKNGVDLDSSEYPKKEFVDRFAAFEPNLFNFLMSFLTFNPSKRISAKKALNHPYLKK